MEKCSIHVDGGHVAYAPGEEISGRISWEFDARPESVELRLFWYTSGKGDRDSAVIDSVEVENPPPCGEEAFRFQLPESPYSFSGKLISLVWALELVTEPEAVERLDFILSPTGTELDLQAAGA